MTQRRAPSGQGPTRRPQRATPRSEARSTPRAVPRSGNRPPARRTASTPAGSAGPAGTGAAARRTAAPRPRRLTGRTITLIAVLVALALAYTYPIRVYLTQQSDIARIEAAQRAQRTKIDQLTVKAALWRDPAYVKAQAKSRFFMVMPGEELLMVLDDPDGAARAAGRDPAKEKPVEPDPWYDSLWSSVEAANAAGAR
jgi:cell division protein FtsB